MKMADPKVTVERSYNVPLRREWLKVPKHRRANKAAKALKEFLVRHMKSDKVSIGKYANIELWKNGIRNPPHHIKVDVKKYDNGDVKAELVGAPVEAPKVKKVKKAEGLKGKLQESVEQLKKPKEAEEKAPEPEEPKSTKKTVKKKKSAAKEPKKPDASEKQDDKKPAKKTVKKKKKKKTAKKQ